jgi:pyroglutamyl-peptidase
MHSSEDEIPMEQTNNNILIYTFEKFAFLEENPAHSIAKEISEKLEADFIALPVTYNQQAFEKKLQEEKYKLIIGIGLDIKTNLVKIEKIGLNIAHAKQPDEEKIIKQEEKIITKGALALETSIELSPIINKLQESKVPCKVSYHADTFICNQAYYLAMRMQPQAKNLFIHIPASPKDAIKYNLDIPSIDPELIITGLLSVIQEIKD